MPATTERTRNSAISHQLVRNTRQTSAPVMPAPACATPWPPPPPIAGLALGMAICPAAPAGRGRRIGVVWGNVVIVFSLPTLERTDWLVAELPGFPRPVARTDLRASRNIPYVGRRGGADF